MTDTWQTPDWLLNHFSGHYDPCPINPDKDGLQTEWNSPAYVNPPYSEPKKWVKKAIKQAEKGVDVVMLLKCDPSTQWYKLLEESGARFAFINTRLSFQNPKTGANDTAAFPSVMVFLQGGEIEAHF